MDSQRILNNLQSLGQTEELNFLEDTKEMEEL
jgi:hypothetical protein